MAEKTEIGRRKVLKITGGLSASALVTPTASAGSNPTLPEEAVTKFRQEYGSEAEKIISILSPLYRQYNAGKITYKEYFNNSTFEFLTGDETPKIKSDILKTWRSMPRAYRPENEVIKNHTEIGVGKKFGEWIEEAPSTESYQRESLNDSGVESVATVEPEANTVRYRWNEISQDHGANGAGTADTFAHQIVGDHYSYPSRQKAKATVGVYGSAWAYVRFWRRFIPANSGTHTIRVKAEDIRGNATTGSTTLSIYAIDSNGNRNTKQADSLTTTDGITRYYYKDFSFDSNEEYKIGFELYCTTQTGGGAGTSDYFSDNRGVSPVYEQSQYPEYYVEVETP